MIKKLKIYIGHFIFLLE